MSRTSATLRGRGVRLICSLGCVLGLWQSRPAAAQDVAIRGGTVIPVAGAPIEGGTVLIRDGRIAAVGVDVSIPTGVPVVDVTGKWVLPGLVDAMSYYGIGGSDLNETASPSTPQLHAIEAYYPYGAFGDRRSRASGARGHGHDLGRPSGGHHA
jgi:hypothetical protein